LKNAFRLKKSETLFYFPHLTEYAVKKRDPSLRTSQK
jgi:hypothetical protein